MSVHNRLMEAAVLAQDPLPGDEPGGPRQRGALSDTQLWLLIAEDDHEAFTELFERHAKAVWNYAYRLTASWSSADDLLATAFLTAWRRRASVRLIRESALPWLYTVTGNVCRDESRRRHRFRLIAPKVAGTGSAPDHADRIADDSAARHRLERVVAAIATLPKGEREAVEVCLLGNTSTADAAELFGITEVSVRSRLSRARARLTRITQEQADD